MKMKGTNGAKDYEVVAKHDGLCLGVKVLIDPFTTEKGSGHLIGLRIRSSREDGKAVSDPKMLLDWGVQFAKADVIRASVILGSVVEGTLTDLKQGMENAPSFGEMFANDILGMCPQGSNLLTLDQLKAYLDKTFNKLLEFKHGAMLSAQAIDPEDPNSTLLEDFFLNLTPAGEIH